MKIIFQDADKNKQKPISDILKIETHGFDKKHHLGKFNNGMP